MYIFLISAPRSMSIGRKSFDGLIIAFSSGAFRIRLLTCIVTCACNMEAESVSVQLIV
jgi:hypothetical protein